MPAIWDAGKLIREDSRLQQRFKSKLYEMSEKLMENAEVADAADLSGHPVGSLPNDYPSHVERLPIHKFFHHFFEEIHNGVNRFKLYIHRLIQLGGTQFFG